MADKRHHRGPDPEDEKYFGPAVVPTLRTATRDLCWLLSRGYAVASAVELVGNRYSLTRRQRVAVGRSACSDEARGSRQVRRVEPGDLKGQELWLDGYNVVIGLEAALAGGVILKGCDGCCRDVANIYSRYRRVVETETALNLIGELTAAWGVPRCQWWLDRPVSNSGRFKEMILRQASAGGWEWSVELVFNPDQVLAAADQVIASSDSVILDRCRRWINLSRLAIETRVPSARVLDLEV